MKKEQPADRAHAAAHSPIVKMLSGSVREEDGDHVCDVQALSESKLAQIQASNAELAASQQKLQQSGGILSNEAQLQLQAEIETLNTRVQRQSQDAEAEVTRFQQGLQLDFNAKLAPALEQVGATRGLSFIFSVGEGGIAWANPALDVTADVILALDAAPPTP